MASIQLGIKKVAELRNKDVSLTEGFTNSVLWLIVHTSCNCPHNHYVLISRGPHFK
uniref:Uncharacterized protein n=1 Tax=Amphimedon queenslandica TaxID=400682 RepID=A0A1X7U513_AMPQE